MAARRQTSGAGRGLNVGRVGWKTTHKGGLGSSPRPEEVAHISECVKRSYTSMRILADRCVRPAHAIEGGAIYEAVAA